MFYKQGKSHFVDINIPSITEKPGAYAKVFKFKVFKLSKIYQLLEIQ